MESHYLVCFFGLFGRRNSRSFKDMEQKDQMLKHSFFMISFEVGKIGLK